MIHPNLSQPTSKVEEMRWQRFAAHTQSTRPAKTQSEMADLVADLKRHRKFGKSHRRLNVFSCGDHFHFGRGRTNPKGVVNKVQREKPFTVGQALRKLRRLDEQYERMQDHFNRRRAELIGRLIEADRAAGWLS